MQVNLNATRHGGREIKIDLNLLRKTMITPDWEDINKLDSQNKQLRFWLEQQRKYIKALQRSIPPALLEDLEPNLPTLPNIPESLDLHEPQRMLKNPVEDIQPLFKFSDKRKLKSQGPALPPRISPSTTSQNSNAMEADHYNINNNRSVPKQQTGSSSGNAIKKYFAVKTFMDQTKKK